MKRFLPVLGFGVIVIVIAVVLPLYLAGKLKNDAAWRPLPRGGEIRFHTLTRGRRHGLIHPRPAFGVLLQRSVQARSLQPLFQKPDRSESIIDTESIGVWLAIRGRKGSLFQLTEGELTLPDGQIFYDVSVGSVGDSEEVSFTNRMFQVIPHTAKQLKLAWVIEEKRFEWEIPNPTYREDVPVWNPEPLPQTREIGGFRVTLKDLKLKSFGRNLSNWRAYPSVTVWSSDGKDLSPCFSLSHTFCDAGGNENYLCGLLSASAWKVKTHLSRNSIYPFAENEVQWIGTVGNTAQETFGAEQYTVFPLEDAARKRGVRLAGLFGPGQYDINKEGDLVRAGPLVKAVPRIQWLHESSTWRVNLGSPAFLTLDNAQGVSVFRDLSNQPVQPGFSSCSQGAGGRLTIYPFPKDSIRFGVADEELPSSSTQEVEFIVRPPAIPTEKAVFPR